MKEIIKQAIEKYGVKHFTRSLKKDLEFIEYLDNNTDKNLPFIERIAHIYFDNKPCEYNKNKKFLSILKGYGFCGRANVCECLRKEISDKKINLKEIEKEEIKNKRIKTNKEKYGVSNILELYKNTKKPSNIEKYKKTMLEKYGVDNGLKLPEVIDYRYNNNPLKNPKNKDKIRLLNKNLKENNHFLKLYYEKLKNKFLNYNIEFLTPLEKYKGVNNKNYYDFKCLACDYIFKTWIDDGHLPICKICNPKINSYSSNEEKEVSEYIKSLNLKIETKNKTLINPYELDIFIPEKNIAIEYCGLYWHSNLYKDKFYHKNKFLMCKNKNIDLITIFSDEWVYNKEEIKNKLKNILFSNLELDIKEEKFISDNRWMEYKIAEKIGMKKIYEKQPKKFFIGDYFSNRVLYKTDFFIYDCGYFVFLKNN